MSQAIASFTKLGFDVSIPLTESAHYDLVLDTSLGMKRLQVRFTSKKDVDLRRVHSNSNGYVVKKALENAYDWLYVYKENGQEYLFPACLFGRRSVRPMEKDVLVRILQTEKIKPEP